MEAPELKRIWAKRRARSSRNQARSVSIKVRPTCQIVRRSARSFVALWTESSEAYEVSNVVETALARALVLAAETKRVGRCHADRGEAPQARQSSELGALGSAQALVERQQWERSATPRRIQDEVLGEICGPGFEGSES